MEKLRTLKTAEVAIATINEALERTEDEKSKIQTKIFLQTMHKNVERSSKAQWWMVTSYKNDDKLVIVRKGSDEKLVKMPTMLIKINPPSSKQSNLMHVYQRDSKKTTVYREKTEVPSKDAFEKENVYTVDAPASDKSDDEVKVVASEGSASDKDDAEVKVVAVEPAEKTDEITEDDEDEHPKNIPQVPPPQIRVKQRAKLVNGNLPGSPPPKSAFCTQAAQSATPQPLQEALGEPFSFGQKLSNEPFSFGRNSSDTEMEDARRFAGVGGSQPCGSGWGGPLLDTKPPVKRVVIDMTEDPITPGSVLGKRPREDMSFEEKLQTTRAEMQQNLAEMRKRWAAAGLKPKKA